MGKAKTETLQKKHDEAVQAHAAAEQAQADATKALADGAEGATQEAVDAATADVEKAKEAVEKAKEALETRLAEEAGDGAEGDGAEGDGAEGDGAEGEDDAEYVVACKSISCGKKGIKKQGDPICRSDVTSSDAFDALIESGKVEEKAEEESE